LGVRKQVDALIERVTQGSAKWAKSRKQTPPPLTDKIVVNALAETRNSDRAVRQILAQLQGSDLAALVVFATPECRIEQLASKLQAALPGVSVLGCTTAGEIGKHGYQENSVVAIGFPRTHFVIETVLIDNLSGLGTSAISEQVATARNRLATKSPFWEREFGLMLIDGLSMKEDQLASALVPVLGTTPLLGGSAGDGLNFGETRVFCNGVVHSDAAILALVRTRCPFKIVRFDNFQPTDVRMVVTKADPENRLVKEINAEPAAREYARLVGKDPDQLSPSTFAAHPIVVRVGGQHHVRAIRQVEETGYLRFLSAIDEGLVLTVATGHDLVSHLRTSLDSLSAERPPDTIIACDCILRRLDAQIQGASKEVSDLLAENGVVGFSTYGEQVNGIHVNQTFVGIAIYPPEDENP